jgi:hypothetical protein
VAEAVTDKKPWQMNDDDEYIEHVRMQPTAEEAIKLALRESRFVSCFFPPYSSGATDMIDRWMDELKMDWETQRDKHDG